MDLTVRKSDARPSLYIRGKWTLIALFAAAVSVAPGAVHAQGADRSGKEVVAAVCIACHGTGEQGAPKIGDMDAWVPRLSLGLDHALQSAIHGHGSMPARGGMADLTDVEVRRALVYMINPTEWAARKTAPETVERAPQSELNHRLVGGIDVYLGFARAESLLRYSEGSPERTMHGGVPRGTGYYHLNVSLLDNASNGPINGARVEARLEQPGLSGETKPLEAMDPYAASYGNYFRVRERGLHTIIVRIRAPGSGEVETRFERRLE